MSNLHKRRASDYCLESACFAAVFNDRWNRGRNGAAKTQRCCLTESGGHAPTPVARHAVFFCPTGLSLGADLETVRSCASSAP